MKVDILLGLQWGDEGKGKVVDVLTPKYDVVARFQGFPIVQSICEGGDSGKPVALNPDSITGQAFQKLAENVVKQIDYRNEHLDQTKRVVVTKK